MFSSVTQALERCATYFSRRILYFQLAFGQRGVSFVSIFALTSGRTFGEAGCRWFHTTGKPKTRYARLYEGFSGGVKPPASGFAKRPAGRESKPIFRASYFPVSSARIHSPTMRANSSGASS